MTRWLVDRREDAVRAWMAQQTERTRWRLRVWDALLDAWTFGGRL